jgi:hypothetical protein
LATCCVTLTNGFATDAQIGFRGPSRSKTLKRSPAPTFIALSRNLAKSARIIARFWRHFAMDKWEVMMLFS